MANAQAALPGIQLVSLLKGAGLEQLERCSFRHRFVTAQAEINSQLDFTDMAAVMACCDLVITTDPVIALLAGSLAGTRGPPGWKAWKSEGSTRRHRQLFMPSGSH